MMLTKDSFEKLRENTAMVWAIAGISSSLVADIYVEPTRQMHDDTIDSFLLVE